jgi:hypothetical protein
VNGGGSLLGVVLDANVYIDAVSGDNLEILGDPLELDGIPSLPPRRVHPSLHVLGVIRDGGILGRGYALEVSEHILAMVDHKLIDAGWMESDVDTYIDLICDLAELSGGGYYRDVPQTQHDCEDPEDNLILDLAAFTDASLIVSNDSDLLVLGRPNGWKGRGIVSPADFTKRAEAAMRYR